MSDLSLSKEENAALSIQALLQASQSELFSDDDTQELLKEIDNMDFEEEKPKKSRKGTKKKSNKDLDVAPVHYIPETDDYKNLNMNLEMQVRYTEHDIHYKEQLWGIPSRALKYKLEIVKMTKTAKDISDKMNGNSEEERRKAENGEVRYFRLVNHDENIYHMLREIAYVKVEKINGKFKTKVLVKSTVLKQNNGNPDKVKEELKKLVQQLVA